jgi:glycosyltransferase involved in cell wall biosynthesis
MHILLVADGRSPITQRWIQALFALHHEVTLVSTFPCEPVAGLRGFRVIPVAFAGLGGNQMASQKTAASRGKIRKVVTNFRGLFLSGRYIFGPFTLPFFARQYRHFLSESQPDLVHALRIPFEGMLAAFTPKEIPFIVSIWGNDLTLHAAGSPWMGSATCRTLDRADGLAADAARDIRLGHLWGFSPEKPTLVVPGGGGIDLVEIYQLRSQTTESQEHLMPAGVPLVINPRGFRPGSVNNEVFFQSIPLVLDRMPNVHFVCTAMANQPEAEHWVQKLRIGSNVHLLPYLSQPQLWSLFLSADVSVSVSSHDGTPNSLLEAMACGCFPVAGDIESLREWITPGVNGFLVEPSKAQGLAKAVLLALGQPDLRKTAAEFNLRLIRERAETNLVRSQIQVFYQRFVH